MCLPPRRRQSEQKEQAAWPLAGMGPSSFSHCETAYRSRESGGCLLVTSKPRCALYPKTEGRRKDNDHILILTPHLMLFHHYGQIHCTSTVNVVLDWSCP